MILYQVRNIKNASPLEAGDIFQSKEDAFEFMKWFDDSITEYAITAKNHSLINHMDSTHITKGKTKEKILEAIESCKKTGFSLQRTLMSKFREIVITTVYDPEEECFVDDIIDTSVWGQNSCNHFFIDDNIKIGNIIIIDNKYITVSKLPEPNLGNYQYEGFYADSKSTDNKINFYFNEFTGEIIKNMQEYLNPENIKIGDFVKDEFGNVAIALQVPDPDYGINEFKIRYVTEEYGIAMYGRGKIFKNNN